VIISCRRAEGKQTGTLLWILFAIGLVSKKEHIGAVKRTYWGSQQNILGQSTEHTGAVNRTYWGSQQNILGQSTEHTGAANRTYWGSQ